MSQGTAFTIFGRPIAWYGIIIAFSVLIGILMILKEAKRRGYKSDHMMDFFIMAIVGGVLGGRIYYVVFEFGQYKDNLIRMFYIWEGGMAIYGVVIGGVIAAAIFAKWRKVYLFDLLDMLAPALILGQGLGRWGNYFNQEAFGPAITNPAWQWFPFAVLITHAHYANGVLCEEPWHAATFFYESVWNIAVFAFLMWYRHRPQRQRGDVFFAYLALYGLGRMFIEGLRQDSLWLIRDVIRVSQLLSLILVIVFGFIIIRRMVFFRRGIILAPIGPAYKPGFELEENPVKEMTGKKAKSEAREKSAQEQAEEQTGGQEEDAEEPDKD